MSSPSFTFPQDTHIIYSPGIFGLLLIVDLFVANVMREPRGPPRQLDAMARQYSLNVDLFLDIEIDARIDPVV